MNFRREKYRQGLASLYLPFYDALCGVLPEEWQPYSGLRTIEEQDLLWGKGRSLPGAIVTYKKGGQSSHNYGCATDWIKFKDGVPQWKLPRAEWEEYELAVAKAGLRWGGDWNRNGSSEDEKFLDFPHNELVIACSWNHVYRVYSINGLRAAMEHVERNMG